MTKYPRPFASASFASSLAWKEKTRGRGGAHSLPLHRRLCPQFSAAASWVSPSPRTAGRRGRTRACGEHVAGRRSGTASMGACPSGKDESEPRDGRALRRHDEHGRAPWRWGQTQGLNLRGAHVVGIANGLVVWRGRTDMAWSWEHGRTSGKRGQTRASRRVHGQVPRRQRHDEHGRTQGRASVATRM